MKVTCPNCKKVLQAPEKWAGQVVKCPACKRPITLPAKEEEENDLSFDLGSLGSVEDGGEVVKKNRSFWRRKLSLKEAQAASDEQAEEFSADSDPRVRICPKCHTTIHHDDIYASLICRSCGQDIPGIEPTTEKTEVRYVTVSSRMTSNVTFYTGFSSAALYPIGAIDSILKGMLIALIVIAVPVCAILGLLNISTLNSLVEKQVNVSWVSLFMTVAFAAEAVYLGAVAYHVLIDTIRTTSAGIEKPAALVWNPVNIGAAIVGYLALLAFYALILLILIGHLPKGIGDVYAVTTSMWKLVVIALLTFAVPMNILGLASSHPTQGLNLIRVFKSIAQVLGHYIFLFLMVLFYLGVYIGIMNLTMGWAGPAIVESARNGLGNGLVNLIMSVVAWSVVMGLGFYFAYSLGRILGLFFRTYRPQLNFD